MKAKTISISAKCSDLCSATLLDKDGTVLHEADGYVPGFFPDQHYGDYVMLDIDLATGQITNWKAPNAKAIAEWVAEASA